MDILNTINSFVWGPPLMVLLIGTGILLKIRFITGHKAANRIEIDFYCKKYRQRRYQ
jgi:AGCS family alanine or glycine:cation symporter